jgi:sigma-B regulation protein RsbU (phosphoserine phosphatase)
MKPVRQAPGMLEKICLLLLLAYVLLTMAGIAASIRTLLGVAVIATASAVLFRLMRAAMRKTIWSLRNRLYVAYLFIAVVPITLILALVAIGGYLLTGQMAAFLVTSELERRTAALQNTAEFLAGLEVRSISEWVRRAGPQLERRFPGLQLLVRNETEWRFPQDTGVESPPAGWGNAHGVVLKGGFAYVWAHASAAGTEVTALVPLTRSYLADLVPNLGDMNLLEFDDPSQTESSAPEFSLHRDIDTRRSLPPPVSRFDAEVSWGTPIPVAVWESPNRIENELLSIRSRPSAVLGTVMAEKVQQPLSLIPAIFFTAAALFLVTELVSLRLGVSITRTITGAVENLYEGTQRVMEGDFSHRIEVKGADQLGELGRSFNRMTENLERLVVVEKEKERLHSELEIAREVQSQLFPKMLPDLRTLRLTAFCNPASMVSGDYYDYQRIGDTSLGLAIGDVAGKGISAALLMATVQAVLRTQIRSCLESGSASGQASVSGLISTSKLVSQLNHQLHAYTSTEKYATFYFGLYDDASGILTYTNAGHLPPILLRDGTPQFLEVNGMVVGAFPFAQYDESRIEMKSGDLLVCYTDGITEPENEYGEMFGEKRLIEVLSKHVHRNDEEVMNQVMQAVHQWTGSPELQDDMTLLLARRR